MNLESSGDDSWTCEDCGKRNFLKLALAGATVSLNELARTVKVIIQRKSKRLCILLTKLTIVKQKRVMRQQLCLTPS